MKFDQIVFAGGGNRCFWQAGFWTVLKPELEALPKDVASVSAGSAMASAILMDRIEDTLDATISIMKANKKNRYYSNLFTKEPIHPHAQLYRKIIHLAITNDDVAKLKKGANNHISLTRIPRYLGPRSATLTGILAYQLEKKLYHPVHPSYGRKLGFYSEFVPASSCSSVDELGDLILGSSCTPPFTPILYRDGAPVLDGGMVDNVPLDGVRHLEGDKLVLLTRPYKSLPNAKGIKYVQPSKAVPSNSWDYTDPVGVKQTFIQGQDDAYRFLENQNMR